MTPHMEKAHLHAAVPGSAASRKLRSLGGRHIATWHASQHPKLQARAPGTCPAGVRGVSCLAEISLLVAPSQPTLLATLTRMKPAYTVTHVILRPCGGTCDLESQMSISPKRWVCSLKSSFKAGEHAWV